MIELQGQCRRSPHTRITDIPPQYTDTTSPTTIVLYGPNPGTKLAFVLARVVLAPFWVFKGVTSSSAKKAKIVYRLTRIKNAPPFSTRVLARTNYQADLFQILHGSVFGDSKWDSRGTFLIFDLEPLVRGTPGGHPDFNNYLISGVPGRK